MPQLVPVDHDPFADDQPLASPRLVPVDHDPFAGAPGNAADGAALPHKSFTIADTWPARLAKTVVGALELPHDVGSGQGDVAPAIPGTWSDEDEARLQLNNANFVDRAKDLAAIATPVSVAARAGEGAFGVPITAKPPPAAVASEGPPSIDALKDAATAAYESPEVTGLTIQPHALVNLSDRIQTELNSLGVDENLAPKTFSILSKATKAPDDAVAVSGQNLNALRKTLNHAAASTDPTERLAARTAIDKLDDFGSAIRPEDVIAGDPAAASARLQEARGNYAAAKRAQTIQEALEKARNSAGAANSGMNGDNAARQQIRSILNSPQKRRGFSNEELEQMRTIARGTRAGDAVRFLGNLLGGGGGLGSVVTGTAAGLATGGIGSAVPLVGFAFKKLGSFMTEGQINKLDEMIRARSPLAESIRQPLHDWGSAVQEFERNPTAQQAIAKLSIATGDLAANLNGAGIKINPPDVINSVRSQGDGRRQNPVQLEVPEDVHHGAERTELPSPAQAEAGNYSKRHLRWKGLDLSIETERGQDRSGIGRDGKPWSTTMAYPYGYIRGNAGADREPVDFYLGPHPHSQRVYVFDQVTPKDARFDEHKVVLGAASTDEARGIYDSGFSDASGPQRRAAVREFSVAEFRQWLDGGDLTKPVAYEQPAARPRTKQPVFSIRPTLAQLMADKRPAAEIRKELEGQGLLS